MVKLMYDSTPGKLLDMITAKGWDSVLSDNQLYELEVAAVAIQTAVAALEFQTPPRPRRQCGTQCGLNLHALPPTQYDAGTCMSLFAVVWAPPGLLKLHHFMMGHWTFVQSATCTNETYSSS